MTPTDYAETARPPRLRPLLPWAGLALLATLAALGGYEYVDHHRVEAQAVTAAEDTDRREPNWRMPELEAARAAVPDDNSACLVHDAAALLPQGWGVAYSEEFTGRSHMAFDAERLQEWRAQLKDVQPALVKARELESHPAGRHPLRYQANVLSTLLPHVQEVGQVITLLLRDAVVRADEGDYAQATASCRAAVNAARSLGDEPFLVSQMARLRYVSQACVVVQFLLGRGAADECDLGALQRLLETEDRHPGLLIALRGERAMAHDLLEALATGRVKLSELPEEMRRPLRSGWLHLFSEDAARRAQVAALRLGAKGIEAVEKPPHQREQLLLEYETLRRASPDVANLQFLDLRALDHRWTRLNARLRCTVAALAVERYRLARGDWPQSLDDLAPDFLEAVPADPSDGAPLRYRRYDDGAAVYSAGAGRRRQAFDPGTPELAAGTAVRLWDADVRGKKDVQINWRLER